MKLDPGVYLLSALCLIFLPGPCTGSSSSEVSVSITALDEGNQIKTAMESPELLSGEKSPESLHPVERSFSANQGDEPNRITDENTESKPSELEEPLGTIADPLEPVNRAFFHFNDKLYFWVLKPIATGYKTIIPEDGRIGVRNFFSNLTTPVRLVNCLLQANPKCAGKETLRFVLNTTIGVVGLFDPAKKRFNIEKQDKDFGQTLGIWGMGPVFYLDLPILGPSSLRDGLGYAVDTSFNPQTYLAIYFVFVGYVNTGGWILEKINEASLTIGEYEDLKKAALDPYIALREAYYQYRQNKIKK
jgi:phospholipid-binding lipoprotein MlaA